MHLRASAQDRGSCSSLNLTAENFPLHRDRPGSSVPDCKLTANDLQEAAKRSSLRGSSCTAEAYHHSICIERPQFSWADAQLVYRGAAQVYEGDSHTVAELPLPDLGVGAPTRAPHNTSLNACMHT